MIRGEIISFLGDLEPFSALPPAAVHELSMNVAVRTFEAKEIIFLEATNGELGYILVSGRIALLKSSGSGKELIVELLGPRDLFGVVVLLKHQPYPLTARAQVPSTVLALGRSPVQGLFKQYPELHQGLVAVLSRRLHSSHNMARSLAHDRVEVRIATVLSILAEKAEIRSVLDIGRQELADLCGITIETASRIMKGWEKEGVVDLSQFGAVRLLDEDYLRRLSENPAPK